MIVDKLVVISKLVLPNQRGNRPKSKHLLRLFWNRDQRTKYTKAAKLVLILRQALLREAKLRWTTLRNILTEIKAVATKRKSNLRALMQGRSTRSWWRQRSFYNSKKSKLINENESNRKPMMGTTRNKVLHLRQNNKLRSYRKVHRRSCNQNLQSRVKRVRINQLVNLSKRRPALTKTRSKCSNFIVMRLMTRVMTRT